MWHQNSDSHQKIGGQTQVLTWSFCCRIHILFANWCLESSFKTLGDQKSCYSELRILISSCHVWPKFEFVSKFGGQTRVFTWCFAGGFSFFLQIGAQSHGSKPYVTRKASFYAGIEQGWHSTIEWCGQFWTCRCWTCRCRGYRRFRRSLHLQFPAIAVSADLLTYT